MAEAADQGDADAQKNLDVLYEQGQGVAQDFAEAAKWLRKAADQGYAAAQRAEVNAKANDGRTALMMASGKGHREVSELLIKAGAK